MRPFYPLHFLRTCWRMRPLTAIAMVILVAGPWYVWVGLRTEGEWLRVFFLEHNLGRAANSMEGHHGSILFYPIAILVGFFPWSIFAAPLIVDLVHRLRAPDNSGDNCKAGYIFSLCWVGVYVSLFTIAKTKLPSYITPCYPGLALLTGAFIDRWAKGEVYAPLLLQRIAWGALGLVGLVMVVALPLAAQYYLPGEQWLGVALGLIPLLGAAVVWRLAVNRQTLYAARSFVVMAAGFIILLFAVAAVRVDRHQRNHEILAAITRHSSLSSTGQGPQIASFGRLEPSWVFYAGRPIREFGFQSLASPGGRQLLKSHLQSSPPTFLITTSEYLPHLQKHLGHTLETLAEAPYFLRRGETLVLLRRKPVQPATAEINVARRAGQRTKK